jgi:hypothetical protein
MIGSLCSVRREKLAHLAGEVLGRRATENVGDRDQASAPAELYLPDASGRSRVLLGRLVGTETERRNPLGGEGRQSGEQ